MSIVRRSIKAVVPAPVRRRLRAAQHSATEQWRRPPVPHVVLRAPADERPDENPVVLGQLHQLAEAHAATLARVDEVLRSIAESSAATSAALAESAARNAAEQTQLVEMLRSISMAQDDDVTAARSVHQHLRLISERLGMLEHLPLVLSDLAVAPGEENAPALSRDR